MDRGLLNGSDTEKDENMQEQAGPQKQSDTPPENFDFIQVLLTLWRYKYWIVACTFFITATGVVRALLANPVYYSYAIIATKDRDPGGGISPALALLSGVSIQNTVIQKIGIILKGRELAETMVREHDLMPILYPKLWDPARRTWKDPDPEGHPSVAEAAKHLVDNVIVFEPDLKRNLITVGANAPDSALAKKLVEIVLEELNNRIRNSVMNAAAADREYLEMQLGQISDPALLARVEALVAFQIERAMLVSSQAFEIVERPMVPLERAAPKRKRIVILFFLLGGAFSLASVFAWVGFVNLKGKIRQRRELSRNRPQG